MGQFKLINFSLKKSVQSSISNLIVSAMNNFVIFTVLFLSLQNTSGLLSRVRGLQQCQNTYLHLNKLENCETPVPVADPQFGGSIMTLSRFIIEATRANPDHADLESLITSIQVGCKTISNLLSRSGVTDLTGYNVVESSKVNSAHPLYDISSNILKNALRFTGKLGVVTFETEEQPMLVEEAWNSKYIAVFDPLDGASNIDVGIVTGTIFGIFKEDEECLLDFGEEVSSDGIQKLLMNLRPGANLVASGYCMYSSSTVMMLTLGDGVHGFTLDQNIGEFILTHPNVKIPTRGRTYSMNEARSNYWPAGLAQYVQDIKMGRGETRLTYTARYIGSMVGDIHRTLLYGGVFGYPGDSKSAPNGKLRLLHEVAPMAFLMEQAGGLSSTGKHSILREYPKTLQDHVSTFLGSKDDVLEIERYLKEGSEKERFNSSGKK